MSKSNSKPLVDPQVPEAQISQIQNLEAPRADAQVLAAIGSGARSPMRWPWVLAVLALLAGITAFVLPKSLSSVPQSRYAMAPIQRGDLTALVSATGRLQGLNTVELGAEVSGRVVEVLADFNQHVKKGQVLAVIDPEQLRSAVDESRAQLASAKANVVQASATALEARLSFERSQIQLEKGLISRRDHEGAQAALARADATLVSAKASTTLAQAALASASTRLSKATIRAPMDGMVLARLIEPGQTVTAGFQTPVLFKLTTDLTQMTMIVDIDEADIGRVREGQKASFGVDAYNGKKFSSRVEQLRSEPTVSQNVVTYQAVLSVDNAEGLLRPGMTATAQIETDSVHNALLVPNAALRFSPPAPARSPFNSAPLQKTSHIAPGKPRVWILDRGKAKVMVLSTGLSDGIQTEIRAGDLAAGSQVIVNTLTEER